MVLQSHFFVDSQLHYASIESIVVDAERVQSMHWPRKVFNACAEDMVGDFELQCQMARRDKWKLVDYVIVL